MNIIKELYHNDAFKLAKNQSEFDPDKHDGLIHYECLCLRRECLKRTIGQKYESYDQKCLIEYLKSQGTLKLGKNTNENNIPCWNAQRVNTEAAYLAWGLSIDDLERRYKKLNQLKKLA